MSNSRTHSVAAHRQASCSNNIRNNVIVRCDSERGGARLNFLIVLFVITVVGYGIANYAPVAYKAAEYKSEMQAKVDQAAAFGYTGEWVSTQLRASAAEYDVPPDAAITAQVKNGRMEADVIYVRPIPLPGFIYNYKFEHTARSTNLFGK